MAVANLIKSTWDPNCQQAQADLAVAFQEALLTLAQKAGIGLGTLDVEGAGKFGVKLEERFTSATPKSHRFYRASAGSTIERLVYTNLLWATDATNVHSDENMMDDVESGKLPGKVAGVYEGQLPLVINQTIVHHKVLFALEYTGSYKDTKGRSLLPNSFSRSRPDIRLSLGPDKFGGYHEAIYDLTSEAQQDHVLKKGDNWLGKKYVPYISEIIWTNDDILLKL
jgi:hypothetical protein